jgi:hypothetical protein
VICRLSQEGQEFMKALWTSGRVQTARVLEVMTPEQLEIVARGTEVFIEAAKKLQAASVRKKAPESSGS